MKHADGSGERSVDIVLPAGQTGNDVPTFTVKISGRLRQQITAAAKRQGITPSQLVREAIEMSLRQEPLPRSSMYDLISDLIGTGNEGPTDLSTNKKYMEGFGLDNRQYREKFGRDRRSR